MNHIKNHLLDIDHLSKDFIYDFFTETKKIKYSPETSKNFNHEKNICALFYENSTRTK